MTGNSIWKKCPVCDGSGTAYSPSQNTTSAVCSVCNGRKIISMVTGQPPSCYSADVLPQRTWTPEERNAYSKGIFGGENTPEGSGYFRDNQEQFKDK